MIYQPASSVMNQLVARAEAVTGIEAGSLRARARETLICHVRFAVMALARERGLGLARIAKGLGGRDHSTIISGLKRAEALRADPDFAKLLEAIAK
ncbi:helix-turn-helix domain-containing protein [Sphingosinicella rhizophila]|uniref:Helix-turn-helix domain-containing protein n=1 Tax=Sphingosinicella rhizophila TaxID=3050082 RepID=A0ABU3Q9G6_9SPHN|nr:helix-turn-helix domain-containing protein [Sphingosinicella sp. GR2756]MDT9600051.1 helix-turn-helix domain-containing protein [Sphingosinicella sp. GR2756]